MSEPDYIVHIPERDLILPQAAAADESRWARRKTWAGLCPWRGDDVKVAILDSGCDVSHTEFAGKIAYAHNMITGTTDVTDTVGHGTNVAGMVTMLAPNARLGIFKVSMSSDGSADVRVIAAAISKAREMGFYVANASYDISPIEIVRQAAIPYAYHNGVLVAAGGNSGPGHVHDADSNILAIGATDRYDVNPPWTELRQHIDVFAPGVQVFTTAVGGGYSVVSGTSFASPFVAGLCVLIKQVRPDYNIAQVYGCLRRQEWFNRANRVNVALAAYSAKMNWPKLEV